MNFCHLLSSAKEKDKNAIEILINKFSPKIKNSLNQTHLQEQEDLQQEIKVKIYRSYL